MPRLLLESLHNLSTAAQKELAYKNLMANSRLMNTPDGKKAASILEVALGKTRTFPEVLVIDHL